MVQETRGTFSTPQALRGTVEGDAWSKRTFVAFDGDRLVGRLGELAGPQRAVFFFFPFACLFVGPYSFGLVLKDSKRDQSLNNCSKVRSSFSRESKGNGQAIVMSKVVLVGWESTAKQE